MDSTSDTGIVPVWAVPGYRHERELGSGATGRVMLARHEATGTPVAIKYLVRSLHSAPDFRTAYRTEAVLLGELHSPHVARLYEYVEGDEGAAIVMELVEGVALRELLHSEGATSPEAALVVLKGSLLGLAAAHEAGVVHRDYKPENVLVTAEGESKLVDFGIAARSGETGTAAGTPLYMAPEQFAGEPAEPTTDVYAATATFFECVTGSKPYSGTTVMELMIQHAQSPIPDELAPEQVRPLIRSGLAKAPQDRPPSAAAFVEALEDVARAGYGEDWEEQGQRKLATLVAMLPLLLLGGTPAVPSASTALAETDLGSGKPSHHPAKGRKKAKKARKRVRHLSSRASKALIGSIAAGGVIAAAAIAANHGGGAGDGGPVAAGYGATAGATTSVAPTQSAAAAVFATSTSTATATAHGPSSSASASPSASQSVDAAQMTPSAGSSTGPAGTGSSPSPVTGTTPTTGPTTPSTSPSSAPPPPPTLHVYSVGIKTLGCSGKYAIYGNVEVKSDGAAAGTLYLTWFYLDSNGAEHDVETDTPGIPAQTDFTYTTKPYAFGTESQTWGLRVSTNPAATDTGNPMTILATSCEIQ